jgi:small subunit ribosomal protein S8
MVTKTTPTSALRTNVTDPVGDMLTRIRNASLAYKDETLLPASNMNGALLRILRDEGYIDSFELEGDEGSARRAFRVRLKYGRGRERTISGLKRVSKPGRRVYVKRGSLPRVLGGLGIAIVSTSQGVMTDRDAARRGVGGEVLAYVW